MKKEKINNKKVKVIVTNTIRKGLRKGDVCNISKGYANYLFNNQKVIFYTPFMEQVYNIKSVSNTSIEKNHSNLNVHLNDIYLHFVRSSNKSFTLYGKITKENIFDAMKQYLINKNISQDLLDAFSNINVNSIITLPNIKTSNQIYTLDLQGPLENTKIHLCVGSTIEQCQQLQQGAK